MPKDKILHILLVDDDATDRELFTDACHATGKTIIISEAADGAEAIRFLLEAQNRPHLVVLDLNMPVKDGRETLQEIKKMERFNTIPVCVMSTSSAHFDVANAYACGASLFLVKPFDIKGLKEMVAALLVLFDSYVTFAQADA